VQPAATAARSPYPDVAPGAVPDALREWRARGEGRIVSIGKGGVGLHELARPTQWFPSVDAAVAAVSALAAE
jgi:hypothetical protein